MAKVKINFVVDVEVHHDKKAKAWVYSHKKYNVSGYSETRKKAKEMFFYCMNDILIFKKQNLNK